MQIRSADRSIIKAIRQRGLLAEWSRQHADMGGRLPSFDKFRPAFFEEEKGDMLMYGVADEAPLVSLIAVIDTELATRRVDIPAPDDLEAV